MPANVVMNRFAYLKKPRTPILKMMAKIKSDFTVFFLFLFFACSISLPTMKLKNMESIMRMI